MTDMWLRLTEPNANPIWVNTGQIACMYLGSINDGKGGTVTFTVIVVGGIKVHVLETPGEIIEEMKTRDLAMLASEAPRSP